MSGAAHSLRLYVTEVNFRVLQFPEIPVAVEADQHAYGRHEGMFSSAKL
jgi:hypothetical protein